MDNKTINYVGPALYPKNQDVESIKDAGSILVSLEQQRDLMSKNIKELHGFISRLKPMDNDSKVTPEIYSGGNSLISSLYYEIEWIRKNNSDFKYLLDHLNTIV